MDFSRLDVGFLHTVYIILIISLIPIIIFTFWAQWRVSSAFNRFSQIMSRRGITGAQLADAIIQRKNLNTALKMLPPHSNPLENYFDPRDNSIALSQLVFSSPSITALGVSAHEVGHAIQHADKYLPSRVRSALVPVVNLVTRISMPIVMIGFLLLLFAIITPQFALVFMVAGMAMYGASTIFMLATLPVEFNASRRAMAMLSESGALDHEELRGARTVLNAAAMTYVASFLVSLTYFLIFFVRVLIILAATRR
ncbi:MAG: zinc metallopeptidase [Firmicutes bacterium]|nr:zinc metallopeptidase [Bacillota bacterium]